MKKRKKIVDCRARCRCHRRLPPVMVDQCCASACVTNQTTFTSSVLFWFGLFFFFLFSSCTFSRFVLLFCRRFSDAQMLAHLPVFILVAVIAIFTLHARSSSRSKCIAIQFQFFFVSVFSFFCGIFVFCATRSDLRAIDAHIEWQNVEMWMAQKRSILADDWRVCARACSPLYFNFGHFNHINRSLHPYFSTWWTDDDVNHINFWWTLVVVNRTLASPVRLLSSIRSHTRAPKNFRSLSGNRMSLWALKCSHSLARSLVHPHRAIAVGITMCDCVRVRIVYDDWAQPESDNEVVNWRKYCERFQSFWPVVRCSSIHSTTQRRHMQFVQCAAHIFSQHFQSMRSVSKMQQKQRRQQQQSETITAIGKDRGQTVTDMDSRALHVS